MKKTKEALYNSDINAQSNSTDQDELLKGFDKKRRSFLKKLLISTAYSKPWGFRYHSPGYNKAS